ncbi:MAG: ImmA/IrrE family metallo-endopeptidase [Chloroflexi bacterium]|nr:ImmA/IrrE family metallo-endopeptidase [Chloroflexota bacterium]
MSSLAVEKAKQVHQRHPELTFPVDMEWLANAEGCECLVWPFLEPIKEVKQGRWIGIADSLSRKERRYLIAHALAHHLMHCGNQLSFRDWQTSTRRRQEKEADCFAAHILIPEKELDKVANMPQWEIAQTFGVPEELVRQRMSDFATDAEITRWQSMGED